ncbi:hypothetical protein [Hydrocarboniphaga sp.]|uniref:hypothetical protein n=1 Tax=Hydrocarboniphaga sp. TaxID=2033016 RepID=UPI003D0C8439
MTRPQLEAGLRRLTDSLLGAMLGALVYAAWVLFVNWDAGHRIAMTAASFHWVMSTFLTYTGTGVMRQFYRLADRPRVGALLACGGGLLFTYALLISVHHAIGTPHIALTLAAGAIPTLVFCISYSSLLVRTEVTRIPCSAGRSAHVSKSASKCAS